MRLSELSHSLWVAILSTMALRHMTNARSRYKFRSRQTCVDYVVLELRSPLLANKFRWSRQDLIMDEHYSLILNLHFGEGSGSPPKLLLVLILGLLWMPRMEQITTPMRQYKIIIWLFLYRDISEAAGQRHDQTMSRCELIEPVGGRAACILAPTTFRASVDLLDMPFLGVPSIGNFETSPWQIKLGVFVVPGSPVPRQ